MSEKNDQSDDTEFNMGDNASKGKEKKQKAPKEKKPKEKKEKTPKPPKEKKEKTKKPPKEKKEKVKTGPKEPRKDNDTKFLYKKTTILGITTRAPKDRVINLQRPELKVTFLPLLLLFVAAGIIFLINDVIVVARTIHTAWIQPKSTSRTLYLVWFIIGLVIGISIMIRLVSLKPRKCAKEGDWTPIFKNIKIGKKELPELLLIGIILYIFNWLGLGWDGYEMSAVFFLMAGLLILILFKDEAEYKMDKNDVWNSMTQWIKGFSLLGTLIIIFSLLKQIVLFFGELLQNLVNNVAPTPRYLAVNIVFILVTFVIIAFYLFPHFLDHVLEGNFKKVTEENLIIVNFKMPLLLIFVGWLLLFQYFSNVMPKADWGSYFIVCAFILIYVFAPFEINYFEHPIGWLQKKTPEEKEAARQEKLKQKEEANAAKLVKLEEKKKAAEAKEAEKKKTEEEKAKEAPAPAAAKPKKEEPKPEPKPEPKKEEPKPEPKPEPKKEEPKPEPKPETESEKDGEIEDETEAEDYVAFPKIKDALLALFDDTELFSTKAKMLEAIKTLDLPEGLTAEEALGIAKEQKLVKYSNKAPRGWSRL